MGVVAIVGRPNVGKSTLFNRLVGKRSAIVEDTPGVTRDRIYGKVEWGGKTFTIVDTGGFLPKTENEIELAVREQIQIALDEANAVLFVCDGREGITSYDIEIANILRSKQVKVLLLVNKCDNPKQDLNAYEFHRLGLGEPHPISALIGRNTGDFLDELIALLPQDESESIDARLKIAIVGRPNVGKSSIANALIGKQRSIVTDIPGTTRDSIDSVIKFHNEDVILIDTAGLRKQSKIRESIEFYSAVRTIKAIERCDVGIVVIDALRGLEEQDKKIINQVDEARKGIIVAVNKWDLIQDKDPKVADSFRKKIYEELPSYYFVPILFVSATKRLRLNKLLETAVEIKEHRSSRITTSELNSIILPELEKFPPPAVRGRDLRINYITQVGIEPPVFAFFCNFPELLPDSYKRFIERIIRRNFGFEGTPISFIFKKKSKKDSKN
ncbi:MAG: ribosome biogenesis GTPase Der [Ignavibacteria bacterium]|nr:ribosome biogenesis GTPase Der [Ignavibacteria bacterium]